MASDVAALEGSSYATWTADEPDVSETFVQVAGTNNPAIELYRSLGFEEVYRYRCLVPPARVNIGGS
jgi:ribosomal protein S18 acetylase RimI-like enzyme